MRQTKGEKVFNVFNILILLFLSVTILYPYLNQLAISLSSGSDVLYGKVYLIPKGFTWNNYLGVLKNADFKNAAVISVVRVVVSATLSLAVTYCAAYGLTRRDLRHRRKLTIFLMIPAYISAGIIPSYMTLRVYHMINSFWVYILPGMFVFYNMIIIRSFLQELPRSLEEAAKIDGANEYTILAKIIFPLSLPVVATVTLWNVVGSWNDWTTTLMYVTDKELYTLQYLMMQLIKESQVVQAMAQEAAMTGGNVEIATTPEAVKAATLMLTTIPIVLVYPFLQRYFIKGVTLGAVKE